jgi:hypothetical protein
MHTGHERTDHIMPKGLISLTAFAAVIATSVAAHAFTITNLDGAEHTFTILVEDDEWDIEIQPNETLSHLCLSGCSIILSYREDRRFYGNEIVKIVDGRLVIGSTRTLTE